MLWALRKGGLLRDVKESINYPRTSRTVKQNTVIDLIQVCIRHHRELFVEKLGDIQLNPMEETHIVLHVLDNFHIMDMFPAHKKVIKKVLS
mgnify:CR=1 FL=1